MPSKCSMKIWLLLIGMIINHYPCICIFWIIFFHNVFNNTTANNADGFNTFFINVCMYRHEPDTSLCVFNCALYQTHSRMNPLSDTRGVVISSFFIVLLIYNITSRTTIEWTAPNNADQIIRFQDK